MSRPAHSASTRSIRPQAETVRTALPVRPERTRSVVVTAVLFVVTVGLIWIGVESTLAAMHLAPLFLAPVQILRIVLSLTTAGMWVLWVAAGAAVLLGAALVVAVIRRHSGRSRRAPTARHARRRARIERQGALI